MNLFDRLKLAARFVVAPRARYEGARRTSSRTHLHGNVQDARYDLDPYTRHELVRKSRWFERNNAFANRLVDIYEQYTVGKGLRFSPATSSDAYNVAAAVYWQGWEPYADLSSRQSFGVLQSVVARAQFIDGEIFIILTRGSSNRPRVQLVESHRVEQPPNADANTVDGITLDENGRPTTYWIASEGPDGKKKHTPVRAEFVVHVFEPSRPGQLRGIPMLAPVMNDLHDLDDLQVFEMVAAKDGATTTNVVQTETGEIDDEDFIRGEKTDSDGVNRADYYKEILGPGTKVLKWGDEFKQFKAERPSAATAGYWDYLLKKICAGVGIPVELVMPESKQGTTMRSVLDVANAYFQSRSASLADHLRRVYEYVLEVGNAQDPALGRLEPSDWRASIVHAPRSVNVDIGHNSAAAVAEFKTGMRTLQSIYAETGEDWREQLRQKAAEIAYAQELAQEFNVERAEIMTLDPNELSSNNAAATTA